MFWFCIVLLVLIIILYIMNIIAYKYIINSLKTFMGYKKTIDTSFYDLIDLPGLVKGVKK